QRETIKLDLPKFEEFVKFLNSKIF
ncbi:HIT family protein, partial [Campylobacter jejuni]|nr:HIT family protein [Campylobacter jejuni]HEE9014371.1 HIT family protein [Campylobacter jejuni]